MKYIVWNDFPDNSGSTGITNELIQTYVEAGKITPGIMIYEQYMFQQNVSERNLDTIDEIRYTNYLDAVLSKIPHWWPSEIPVSIDYESTRWAWFIGPNRTRQSIAKELQTCDRLIEIFKNWTIKHNFQHKLSIYGRPWRSGATGDPIPYDVTANFGLHCASLIGLDAVNPTAYQETTESDTMFAARADVLAEASDAIAMNLIPNKKAQVWLNYCWTNAGGLIGSNVLQPTRNSMGTLKFKRESLPSSTDLALWHAPRWSYWINNGWPTDKNERMVLESALLNATLDNLNL